MLAGKSNCTGMKQHFGDWLCLLLLPPSQNACSFLNHFSFQCKLILLSGLGYYTKLKRQGGCGAVQAHSLLASSATEAVAISRADSSYCLKMSSQNSCSAELSRQCKVMTSALDSKQKAFSFTFPGSANSELHHAKSYSIETANV